LVVKVYPTGVVSKYFGDLKVGDEVEIKGPIKKFDYVPNTWNAIGMIAGGSGITPMLQLIRAILDNPRDKTEVRLLFANKTPADVILKAELDALAAVHPNFKVTYIVDAGSAGADWKVRPSPRTRALRARMHACTHAHMHVQVVVRVCPRARCRVRRASCRRRW
ncbi:hypothetical protein EON67_08750, partial [archaeon]